MPLKIETVINIQDEVIDLYSRTKDKYSFSHLEEMIAYAVGLGIQEIREETAGKKKLNKEELLKEILFRREAEELVGLSPQAFQKYISSGRIIPCKEYGEGKGKVQLFWKYDVENLKAPTN